jgi:hypothetical protein
VKWGWEVVGLCGGPGGGDPRSALSVTLETYNYSSPAFNGQPTGKLISTWSQVG